MTTPEDSRYATSHEYIHVEGDVGTIGITEYAQKELGDVVFVELPAVGTELEMGDEMGSIESVKAVSEVFAPVGGTVVEINELLADKPELINTDPYGDGWMVKIQLATPDEVNELMNAADYEDYVESESAK
ncbi:MAG: glycine cleavage system protein GcvH [Acidobacteriota bacterium]